ncbi:MAG: NmrA/HSCARG family protein [Saprospiraceae bacterium]|nr:NmrA/HSCARG family protein [Saprospiraceae bacterium]MCB9307070.1 NmrA/HSCARG family protein [Lewinellaceae bacterium]MCB9353989.1 NmrA/HSCARG family protein [Lewinellaceae bacterium]
MKQKQIILVTGATGAQGGSVAYALLNQQIFSVRILTRNPDSERAQALKQAGAEVVEGDMGNPASLAKALEGCYGVFGVTNFWEHFEQEFKHGKNLIEAVHSSGVKHVVLSTLADYQGMTGGALRVPHFDLKAELEGYAKSLQLPATFLRVAFYYENFLGFIPLQKGRGDYYTFGFPQGDTRLSMASAEDIGGIVSTIFGHPAEYIGRVVGAVGEDRPCAEYAAIMSRVFGRDIRYQYIPHEDYAGLDFPGAEELANMFEVQRLYIPNRQMDLIESYGLNPSMQTLEQWLTKNKDKFEEMFAAGEREAVAL